MSLTIYPDNTSSGGGTIGGLVTGGTQGSVLFVGAGGVLAQDNANLAFNDTTNTLTVPVGAFPATGGIQFGTGTILMSRGQNGELTVADSTGATAMQFSAPNLALSVGSTIQIGIASTGNPAASGNDIAFGRKSAGVFNVTNGSTGVRGLLGGGADIASATALPLPTGRVFHVTGTTNITSITATNFQSGVVITLIFDGVLTFTDGNNLKLAGNFVTTADDTITLAYDGTNFYEMCRSVN